MAKKDVITVLHYTIIQSILLHCKSLCNEYYEKKIKYKCWIFRSYIRNRCSNSCCKLGASIIEKHFTLDKNMIGPDHAASLNPSQLKEMVKSIRNIEKAVSGSGLKIPSKSEIKNIKVARKSIHINKNHKKPYNYH